MIDVRVGSDKIALEEMYATAGAAEHGAQILFAGAVRNHNEGRQVEAVTYEAFIPLALQTLREICSEATDKWGGDMTIQVRHRLGRLAIGELSVGILVTSRHRDAAYQASRYVIEQLKIRVPIWKHEHYLEGESSWLKGAQLNDRPNGGQPAAN